MGIFNVVGIFIVAIATLVCLAIVLFVIWEMPDIPNETEPELCLPKLYPDGSLGNLRCHKPTFALSEYLKTVSTIIYILLTPFSSWYFWIISLVVLYFIFVATHMHLRDSPQRIVPDFDHRRNQIGAQAPTRECIFLYYLCNLFICSIQPTVRTLI